MPEDPKQIEREIDKTRNAMDETIDALSDRLNPRKVGDRVMHAAMRHAPAPPDAGRRFYARRPMLMGSIALAAGFGAGYLLSPPMTGGMNMQGGQRLVQRAKQGYQQARDKVREVGHEAVERTREKVVAPGKEAVHEAREKVVEATHGTYQRAREQAVEMAEQTKESVKDVKRSAVEKTEDLKDRVTHSKGSGGSTGSTTNAGGR